MTICTYVSAERSKSDVYITIHCNFKLISADITLNFSAITAIFHGVISRVLLFNWYG